MKWLLPVAIALATGAAQAQVIRCESPDGKVSYAQTNCPPGTQPVRALGAPGKPAPEGGRAATDGAKTLDRSGRDPNAEEARPAKTQSPGSFRAEARARTCKRLALRLKQAKEDVATAPLNRSADAKRRLKKAQENYDLECAAQK